MKAIGKGLSFENYKEGQETPIIPFGPLMYYYKLPKKMVDSLNKYVEKTSKNKIKTQQLDHSNQLVGKVKQEFLIENEELNKHKDIINKVVGKFVETDLARHAQVLSKTTKIEVSYKSAWIVRQYAGDFNPTHVHTECDMSCVGYLKLPPTIDEEWEEDYKDHHPCKGHIEFLHGQGSKLNKSTCLIKPSVGDFFLFPADLVHTVYPFNSEGERRSFSMNIVIKQKQIQNTDSLKSPFQYARNTANRDSDIKPKTKIFRKDEQNV
jgi:uncharacterized protein (TIGR02466 family)